MKAYSPSRRVVLAALAGAALLPGAASAADVFKVGLIADYTGAFATWGPQFQNAIEAFQAIHGKTIKGPKGEDIEVQFVYRDAASAARTRRSSSPKNSSSAKK